MLTPEQFQNIEKDAMYIYEGLELNIIEEIATRIAKVGYANTVVLNDIKIAQEIGILYQDIVLLVAKYNNTSYEKVYEIFESASKTSIAFDDYIYKEAGLHPKSFKDSMYLMELLETTAKKTNFNLNNLVGTTANTSQEVFYNVLNQAYMEVSTGVKSYSTAIIDAIDKVAEHGATIQYPSGYKTTVENAVRTNIVTSVNQMCGKMQEMRADELNWDLMEVTAHPGARPEHAIWQGKIVSRSGKPGYLSLSDIGYGDITGFKGINCRHDWFPFYKGNSRSYSKSELIRLKNEKVHYNGEEMSRYDANQLQRRIERTIRNDKKKVAGRQALLRSITTNESEKILKEQLEIYKVQLKRNQAILRDFSEQTKIPIDISRTKVFNKGNYN